MSILIQDFSKKIIKEELTLLIFGSAPIKARELLIQERGADDTGVIAESADAKLCLLVVVLGVALFLDDLSEGTEQILSLVGDAAADAEHIGLEDVDDVDQTCREVAEILVEHFLGVVVARLHRVKGGLAVDLVDVAAADFVEHEAVVELLGEDLLLGQVDQTCRGGIRLPAALSAAAALLAVLDDDHVTQLRAREVGAAVNLAVDDDAAADACAEGDGNGVLRALCGACEVLSQSRRVRVILDEHLFAEALVHHLGDLPVVEVKVRGILDDAGLRVHRAGNADTDALHLVHGDARLLARLHRDLRHAVADIALGTGHIGLAGRLGDNLVVFVHHTRDDVGTAEVDSESIHNEKTLLCLMIYQYLLIISQKSA